MKIKHKVQIKGGKLKLLYPEKFKEELYKNDGKEMYLTLTGEKRSIKQNNYYWGVVIQILSDYFGYFPEETHHILKCQFLGFHTIKVKDIEYKIPATSTTDLGTKDMETYLDNIRMWAASEYNIQIPLPNEAEL